MLIKLPDFITKAPSLCSLIYFMPFLLQYITIAARLFQARKLSFFAPIWNVTSV